MYFSRIIQLRIIFHLQSSYLQRFLHTSQKKHANQHEQYFHRKTLHFHSSVSFMSSLLVFLTFNGTLNIYRSTSYKNLHLYGVGSCVGMPSVDFTCYVSMVTILEEFQSILLEMTLRPIKH